METNQLRLVVKILKKIGLRCKSNAQFFLSITLYLNIAAPYLSNSELG